MHSNLRLLLLLLWTCMRYGLVDSQLFVSSKQPPCEVKKVSSEMSGRFQYYGQFEARDICLYINAAPDTSAITISFLEFDFGYEDEFGNCTNFVRIGSSTGFTNNRYCGSRIPPTYHTQSKTAWLWIHTEYLIRGMNILLQFSQVPKCGGDVVLSSHTFITSPEYPASAPVGSSCSWRIYLHDISSNIPLQVKLNVWESNVHSRLLIYDGPGQMSPLLADLNENTTYAMAERAVFTTTGPYVTLFFTNLGDVTEYFGSARFNATVKVKGYCLPGTFSCGDGESCYDLSEKCDGIRECSTGYDELGCGKCPPDKFWCGMLEKNCYSLQQYCNGMKDCETTAEDEKHCDSCGPGSFLCKTEHRCIYERWRCDGDRDCADRSDEEDCSYMATRRVITAAIVGSLVCSLLLVIALGCTCKLYSLRASHHRSPHHRYRATPLSRVEREIFQRQAPPTYDMTIDGAGTEGSSQSRQQRQRRHRSRRRYQFQRANPSNCGDRANDNRACEGVEATPQTRDSTSGDSAVTTVPSSPVPTAAQTVAPQDSEMRQSVASFVLESVPDILAEMIFVTRQGQTAQETRPSMSRVTRDSGTQTQPSEGATPSATASTSSYSARRSARNSDGRSHSRRSSRNPGSSANSKEQQAKPLPKKKKIHPVMVPAPCSDEVVEDTLTCVYPCPPSYSQAVATQPSSAIVTTANSAFTMGSNSGSPNGSFDESARDSVFTLSPKSKTKSVFPFSIGQALKNMASSPFSKFQKNPYSQMENMDPATTESEAVVIGNSEPQPRPSEEDPMTQRQNGPRVTNDEMISCTIAPDDEPQAPVAECGTMPRTEASSATTPELVKLFPARKKNGGMLNGSTRPDLMLSESRNSLELFDFSFTEDV